MLFHNWAGQRAVVEGLEPRAYLAAGGLDPSFGSGGKVLADFVAPANSEASAVVVSPDGKVLAAGRADTDEVHSSFALTRFLSDGRADGTFGNSGQVVLSFGGNSVATDVLRLADGKILAVGTVDGRILVARFSSGGVLDKTFGVGGTVLSAARSDFIYERSCVRVQSDGKIVVAAGGGDSTTESPAIHLMRLTSSGAVDASFGNGGSLDVDFGYFDYFAGIELRGDDRIVLGGSYVDQSQHSGIVLMQFLKDGQVDKSFAGTGQVRGHLFNSQEEIKDIAIDNKGRILLLDAEIRQWGVGRFRADGVLDRSFATRGVRYVEIDTGNSKANVETGQLAVQPDGKILSIGDAFVNFAPTDDMVIARLTDGGATDISFGNAGIERVVLKDTGHGNALALRADGTILAAGRSGGDIAVVQLKAGGAIDSLFGTTGIATARLISSGEDAATAMAVQQDGKLILAGSSMGKDGTLAALARYNADGSLDGSFGKGGRVRVALAAAPEYIRAVSVLANGKILAAGLSDYATGFIARFNSDGSIDTTFGQGGIISLEAVYALTTLANGKFLVVCHSDTQELRRYNGDGSLDTSFAAGGVLALPGLLVQSNTLVVQDDGSILIAGSENDDPGNGISFFGVWRITAGGLLDAAFGDGG